MLLLCKKSNAKPFDCELLFCYLNIVVRCSKAVYSSLESNFELLPHKLGKGTNADVWLVERNGISYAAKMYEGFTEYNFKMAEDEASAMSQLSYPFLHFYGLFISEGNPVIVQELFDGVSLDGLVAPLFEIKSQSQKLFIHHDPYSNSLIRNISASLLESLAFLEAKQLILDDIHYYNILSNDERAIFIDISFTTIVPLILHRDEAAEMLFTLPSLLPLATQNNDCVIVTLPFLLQSNLLRVIAIIYQLLRVANFDRDTFVSNPSHYRLVLDDKCLERALNSFFVISPLHGPTATRLLTVFN